MLTASICTIGDEILICQIVDTNSSHISRALGSLGIHTSEMLSIADNEEVIISSMQALLKHSDIVITTGGLGPTKDDITKEAFAKLSGSKKYLIHEGQLEIVHKILHSRGLDVLDINRAQALVPETCEVIENKLGTAPIMVFRFPPEIFGHKASLYSMPGVPFETIAALDDVLADIRKHEALDSIYHRNVMTYGMAESALSCKIADWEDSLPEKIHLAYLPNQLTGVRLRLSIYGGDPAFQKAELDNQIDKLKDILGDDIYAFEDSSLQEAIGKLLIAKGKTLCCAESCTGGTISAMMTSVPGSSEYYLGSVTSYAIEVKEKVLGVPSEIIDRFGAVSSECVAKMAEGVRQLMSADYAVATSGIAGPGGGNEETPVGTVWIAVSSEKGTETYLKNYKNDRKRNMERFAATALDLLRRKILKETSAI